MGDIADMILDGILDEETGEFIDDEESWSGGTGYPRSLSRDRRENKIYHPTYSINTATVFNFLNQRGIKHEPLKINVVKQYAMESNMPQRKVSKICNQIRASQENWIAFKTWIDKK